MLAQTPYSFGVVSDDVSAVTGLLREIAVQPVLPPVVSIEDPDGAANLPETLVFISAASLRQAAPIVSEAARRHRLAGLIIGVEDARWYPQLLHSAGLRTVRNTLVHDLGDAAAQRRILNAHLLGAEDELVARVRVDGDTLVVLTCALEAVDVPFDAHPALRRLPRHERAHVHLSEQGDRISWLDGRIEVDLDGLRYATSEAYREASDLEATIRRAAYGDAIRALRTEKGLRQTDVHGFSERQVRRIERDGTTSLDALRALAAAHNLTLAAYLDALADRAADRAADLDL